MRIRMKKNLYMTQNENRNESKSENENADKNKSCDRIERITHTCQ